MTWIQCVRFILFLRKVQQGAQCTVLLVILWFIFYYWHTDDQTLTCNFLFDLSLIVCFLFFSWSAAFYCKSASVKLHQWHFTNLLLFLHYRFRWWRLSQSRDVLRSRCHSWFSDTMVSQPAEPGASCIYIWIKAVWSKWEWDMNHINTVVCSTVLVFPQSDFDSSSWTTFILLKNKMYSSILLLVIYHSLFCHLLASARHVKETKTTFYIKSSLVLFQKNTF